MFSLKKLFAKLNYQKNTNAFMNSKIKIKKYLKKISDIYKIYNSYLRRDPDLEGLLNALKELESGRTIIDIEKKIQNSEEYNSLIENYIIDPISIGELSKLKKDVTYGIDKHTWNKFSFPSVLITRNVNSVRFQNTITHLKKMSINPHIEIGVSACHIRNYIKKENGAMLGVFSEFNNSNLTASFISHINAIKNIYEKFDSKIYFIMEDSVRLFPDPFMIGLQEICNSKDWDIINLENYLNGFKSFNCNKDSVLYLYGIKFRRYISDIDYGAAGYLIRRDYIKKILDYLFVKTENGFKIDLHKTLLYKNNVAADIFFYQFGNALVSTFPLVQQQIEEKPTNDLVNKFKNNRIASELYNYRQWVKNYSYKKKNDF